MNLPQPGDPIKLIDGALIGQLLKAAERSERLRVNFNFHSSFDDNPQRFLNVLLQETYITPHRHLRPPKAESFLILEGEAAFLIFDDGGNVAESFHLLGVNRVPEVGGAGLLGIDIAPGLWHMLVVLSPHAVIYEVKPGPYQQTADKEFAPWAPREGSPECSEYLVGLRRMFRGRQGNPG